MNTQTNIESKQYSKAVVIIGNGFDLSMGLKTSYKDFVESKYFDCILNFNESLCADFLDFKISPNKNNILLEDNGLAKWIKEKEAIQHWVDLEIEIGNYCKSDTQNKESDIIRKEIFTLRYFLYKYLQFEVNTSTKITAEQVGYEFVKQLLNYKGTFDIWNFNYTLTCNSILNDIIKREYDCSDSLHCLHGNLIDCMYAETAKIIVGTEYDFEIMQICPSAIKANAIENYAEMKRRFQAQLDDADTLIIYGHSMGQTDADYFSTTLKNPTNLKKVFIISKDQDSIDSVKKNIDNISKGIFMQRVVDGEIDCYHFSLESNKVLSDEQMKEFKKNIEKCFAKN